ncbi:MAG: hypothetical protein HUJ54_03045 [Erysipelotrichaceae bacterium]|nr:hypothetical protein [Erysipelotrichaceae bacterium]
MNNIENTVISLLQKEERDEIAAAVLKQLDTTSAALQEKAAGMENPQDYLNLIRYLIRETGVYMTSSNHLDEVLTQPKNIESAFVSLTDNDEFKGLAKEEMRRLPRVMAMSILCGAETAAADKSAEILKGMNPEAEHFVSGLADIYHGYMQDALSYGRGEDKKASVIGTME